MPFAEFFWTGHVIIVSREIIKNIYSGNYRVPGTWLKILAPNQMSILKFPVNVSYPVWPRRSIIINSLFVSPSDNDECLSSNGFCAQQCINTAGSYSCRCNHGFFLDSNGRTCSGKFKCPFLGLRYLIKLRQVNLISLVAPYLHW